jgi:prophage regulatory protein
MTTCKTKLSARPMPGDAGSVDSDPPTAPVTPGTTRPIRLLRLTQVMDVTGLGRTKIYELQAAGHFPMRVQITEHSVGWVEEEVQAWLARRIAARPALPRRSAALRALR